jgi:hypothetical protein
MHPSEANGALERRKRVTPATLACVRHDSDCRWKRGGRYKVFYLYSDRSSVVSPSRSDVCLSRPFVSGLAKARSRIDHGFGEPVVRDAAVGCPVVCVLRLPGRRRAVRPDLEQDEVVFTPEVAGHLLKRLPVEALIVDAEAAPPGSFLNTWKRSGVMPERVLPEPVSPVISQPRQKSARVQRNPASSTTALLREDQSAENARHTAAAAATTAPRTSGSKVTAADGPKENRR